MNFQVMVELREDEPIAGKSHHMPNIMESR